MDSLFKKLDELSDLLKQVGNQLNPSIKMPQMKTLGNKIPKINPATPKMSTGVAPKSKKDPVKIAQQLKNKDPKPKTSFNSLGQWKLT